METSKILISISGATGSGKSYISSVIHKYISEELSASCTLFKQDNYYKPLENQPIDANGQPNFDMPESIDIPRFKRDLSQLVGGNKVNQPVYNYNNSQAENSQAENILDPATVTLVEGIFVAEEFTGIKYNLNIFIDVSPVIQYDRRLKRDLEERGYGKDDVDYKFKHHINQCYTYYLAPLKNTSHIVVDNTQETHNDEPNENIKDLLSKISVYLNKLI